MTFVRLCRHEEGVSALVGIAVVVVYVAAKLVVRGAAYVGGIAELQAYFAEHGREGYRRKTSRHTPCSAPLCACRPRNSRSPRPHNVVPSCVLTGPNCRRILNERRGKPLLRAAAVVVDYALRQHGVHRLAYRVRIFSAERKAAAEERSGQDELRGDEVTARNGACGNVVVLRLLPRLGVILDGVHRRA